MLSELLKEKNMSIYQCSKLTGIPYTTLSEVVRGKTRIGKCTAELVYKLAMILDVTVEELLRDTVTERADFEIYKSNVCHLVKDIGDLDFIVRTLREDKVRMYWNKKWYPEAFYLLATVDYLCRINEVPLCTRYDDIRSQSLKDTLYPRDVMLATKLNASLDVREQCKRDAIPEFMRFNIAEGEIRNVY